ncbi:MAG: hypothetical protein FJ278_08610, partial [Planctomycetes bacterium]|nr:hypothetical protein [Planctomycetota bacterium]
MKTFLLASLVLSAFLMPMTLAQRAEVAGLNLKVDDEGGFRVTYKGVVVIPRGSFYLADKDW